MNKHQAYKKPELVVVEMKAEQGYAISAQNAGLSLLPGSKSVNNGGSVSQYNDGSDWSSASEWF